MQMILFFHFVFLLAKYVVNTLSKSTSSARSISNDGESVCSNNEGGYSTVLQQPSFNCGSEYVDGRLKFSPPVYVQRYEAVNLILKEPPWKGTIRKIVDFGCSDLGFFLYLKDIPGVEEILEVDIDESNLLRCASKAAPLNSDYLFYKRSKPLEVYLLAGNMAEYDDHLLGTDVVIAIEVIEHLKEDTLNKIPYNIFHEIRPRLAIFTTPNADFNVLFPNMEGFRHPDHNFEWSRKEFYNWTQEITKKYPNYSVKFYGIGVGPEGTENLGCCTQMAVFEKKLEDEFANSKPRGINNYKLIRKYNYPVYVDMRTDEMKILHEVLYRVKFTLKTENFYNEEEELFEIPLAEIIDFVNQWCESEEQLKQILLDHGFYVREKDGNNVLEYGPIVDRSETPEADPEELSITEIDPDHELLAENWDWDCGDGSFNHSPDKLADEELPCFESARSGQEIVGSEDSQMQRIFSQTEYPEDIGDNNMNRTIKSSLTTLMSDNIIPVSDCPVTYVSGNQELKSKSMTLSRIPRIKDIKEHGLKNTSKSATLDRPALLIGDLLLVKHET